MLKLENINVYYDKIHAVKNLSLEVNKGEIVSLVGANGAGKSTILNAISGLLKINSGDIKFYGKSIKNLSPEKIVKMGLVQVPEGRCIFNKMTVKENLEIGGFINSNVKNKINEVYNIFPVLKERAHQIAGTLSGGEQQMLAIGRALLSQPRLLMLDEPSMGLAPKFIDKIFKIIQDFKKQNITVFLIEQNAKVAMSISDRTYVIENGKIKINDRSSTLIDNDDIKNTYLGVI